MKPETPTPKTRYALPPVTCTRCGLKANKKGSWYLQRDGWLVGKFSREMPNEIPGLCPTCKESPDD